MRRLAPGLATLLLCTAALGSTHPRAIDPAGTLAGHGSLLSQVTSGGPRTGSTTTPMQWAWGNPRPSGDVFLALAYGNGVYVAVGSDGLRYSSTDGTTWTAHTLSGSNRLDYWDAVYADGQFVLSGRDATGASHLTTSSDGVTWTDHVPALPQGDYVRHLAFGGGTYVAVGNVSVTSTDGVTWHEHPIAGLTNPVFTFSPVYAHGVFAALVLDDTLQPHIFYSTDSGSTWKAATTLSVPTTQFITGLTGNGHGFLLYGIDETFSGSANGVLYTSTDGANWSPAPAAGGGSGFYSSIVWNGNEYITFSADLGLTGESVYTSTDGVTWIQGAAVPHSILVDGDSDSTIIFAGGHYLATSSLGITLQASKDFATWSGVLEGARGPSTHLSTVSVLNGHLLAAGPTVASGDVPVILSSQDGLAWTEVYGGVPGSAALTGLAYGKGLYVAVGPGASVTSKDAVHWTAGSTPPVGNVTGIAFGDGRFVAIAGDCPSFCFSETFTSTDGVTWTQHTALPGTPVEFEAVTFTGKVFVASAPDSSASSEDLYTSPDGINWTFAYNASNCIGTPQVTWTGAQAVAIFNGCDGTTDEPEVATSADGLTWKNLGFVPQPGVLLDGLAFDGHSYYAPTQFVGLLMTSTDLLDWTDAHMPLSAQADAVTVFDGRVVAAGLVGSIVTGESALPDASAGSVATTEGAKVSGTLAGGSNFAGAALTYSLVGEPSHGMASLTDASKGSFTYTPAAGYAGQDSFTFEVSDGIATSSAATESVTVTAAPSGSGGGGGGGEIPPCALLTLVSLYLARRRTR